MSMDNKHPDRRDIRAAFDDATVREIRAARLKTPPPTIAALATKYSTTKRTIRNLVKGRSYKDVE